VAILSHVFIFHQQPKPKRRAIRIYSIENKPARQLMVEQDFNKKVKLVIRIQ
jgi:hypothetical protein